MPLGNTTTDIMKLHAKNMRWSIVLTYLLYKCLNLLHRVKNSTEHLKTQ